MSMASLSERDYLQSIWVALVRLEEAFAALAITPPAPIVEVAPPDLSDIVSAVLSLNGTGPSAEEIARAIAEVLRFPTPEPDESLARVADALEKVSNQLKGLGGTSARGGGGTVSVQVSVNSNVTVVPAVAGAVLVLGANPARKGLIIQNVSNGTLYVKLGPGAATDSFSFLMDPDSYYEMVMPVFTGPITGYWVGPELEALEGNAVVTELA